MDMSLDMDMDVIFFVNTNKQCAVLKRSIEDIAMFVHFNKFYVFYVSELSMNTKKVRMLKLWTLNMGMNTGLF